jgi:hypothetical protein
MTVHSSVETGSQTTICLPVVLDCLVVSAPRDRVGSWRAG